MESHWKLCAFKFLRRSALYFGSHIRIVAYNRLARQLQLIECLTDAHGPTAALAAVIACCPGRCTASRGHLSLAQYIATESRPSMYQSATAAKTIGISRKVMAKRATLLRMIPKNVSAARTAAARRRKPLSNHSATRVS